MLNIGPWNRLPLTIRWIEQDFAKDFPVMIFIQTFFKEPFFINLFCLQVDKIPPIHMPITYGPIVSKKLKKQPESEVSLLEVGDGDGIFACYVCGKYIESGKGLRCLHPECDMICHIACLSKLFLNDGDYIPVSGQCPKCKSYVTWGDLVRKYRGCFDTDAYPKRSVNLIVAFNLAMSH